MPTHRKRSDASPPFSATQVATATAAVRRSPLHTGTTVDWSAAIVSHGGGVAATIADLRRASGLQQRTKTALKQGSNSP